MGARFYKADLKEADFTGADLTGASLEGAALDGAILKNAILQNAYATEVRCDQYRFVFVSLCAWSMCCDEVDLRPSPLFKRTIPHTQTLARVADVTGADFSDMLLDRFVQTSLCKKASGVNPKTGVDTRESLMCE